MKIYKLTSPNTDLVYVGKTTLRLCDRMKVHKYTSNNARNCSSRKIFEFGEVSIELIEETEDKTREKYWITELNSCNERKHDCPKNGRPAYKADWMKKYRKSEVKVECELCGTVITKSNLKKHQSRNSCIKKRP